MWIIVVVSILLRGGRASPGLVPMCSEPQRGGMAMNARNAGVENICRNSPRKRVNLTIQEVPIGH